MPASSELQEVIRLRYPRLLAAGVDYNDAKAVMERLSTLDDWMSEWSVAAGDYERLGEEALAQGNTISAGEAYVRAALYYHTGQSVYFTDAAEKARVQELQQAAYRKGMPYLQPPAEAIEVPFEGITFGGTLRLPVGVRPAPCVVICSGGDSTKEEFHLLENEFLRRGMGTFTFDGPGQSLTWRKMKLRPDFEKPISAALDVLLKRTDIDATRLGIWGRSFGGYVAPRAASFDHRFKACITIGGFFDMATIWERFPVTVKDTLVFGFGVKNHDEARALAAGYSLEGLLDNLKCPLLIVHSGLDKVVPVEESERFKKESAGPATMKIFAEGNHVCDNIPTKVKPIMTDWMAHQLK